MGGTFFLSDGAKRKCAYLELIKSNQSDCTRNHIHVGSRCRCTLSGVYCCIKRRGKASCKMRAKRHTKWVAYGMRVSPAHVRFAELVGLDRRNDYK